MKALAIIGTIGLSVLVTIDAYFPGQFSFIAMPFAIVGYIPFFAFLYKWFNYLKEERSLSPIKGTKKFFELIKGIARERSQRPFQFILLVVWSALLVAIVVYINQFYSIVANFPNRPLPAPVFLGAIPFTMLYIVFDPPLTEEVSIP